MSLGTYRYGEASSIDGLCIGVTRYPPRGVASDSEAARACYDVWLPLLAPSRELVATYKQGRLSFRRFATRYVREMRRPDARHVITTLAAVAQNQPIHLGCFCEDEANCHRILLRRLVAEAGDALPQQPRHALESGMLIRPRGAR